MTRSGYWDDDEDGTLNLYRQAVSRALKGKRGQAFLREMLAALDAMPVKALVANTLVRQDGCVCALGAVALRRGMKVDDLDPECQETVASAFGIARAMAAEIAYENDERGDRYEDGRCRVETDGERWTRMRSWVASLLPREDPTR